MGCKSSNVEEAVRSKVHAEKQFLEKNFVAAQNYALKAQMLCPELEGVSQMVTTFGVYIAAEAKINGELDYYSILGLDPSSERSKLKKQYKKLAVLLHPDKNKSVGADGAFRMVSDAWTVLSDAARRSSYDQRRNYFAAYNGYENCSAFSSSRRRSDSFWTVCTSCRVQYEYLRKYVNKRLSCKNCRGIFVAVETGLSPANSSFPYTGYPFSPSNGHGSHGGACGSSTAGYYPPNGTSGHHGGYRPEYSSSTISFQGSCSSGNSNGFVDPNGLSNSFVLYQANGEVSKNKANGHMGSNGYSYTDQGEVVKAKRGRPAKKIKVESGISNLNRHHVLSPTVVMESKFTIGNLAQNHVSKVAFQSEGLARHPIPPAIDVRQLLINKAKEEISVKLEEMRLAAEAAAAEAKKRKALAKQSELRRNHSMSITVPDSDFHNFDKDRAEECFKPKQIWALYDNEDGMPRLYCLIRDIISVKPFKVYISYLSSRTDTEFGTVNWLDSGFTKSCGSLRVFHSETVEEVNIFSHLLNRERAGRGGLVRIYPRAGDIWAMYRNWSPDWNRSTPADVRHQYDLVEILDNFTEEIGGVRVAPLVKVDGFKTVYKMDPNTDLIRWIPKREMLRFSHQVPSYSLNSAEGMAANLPPGCWDLDCAAIPNEALKDESELGPVEKPKEGQDEKQAEASGQLGGNVSEGGEVGNLIPGKFAELPQGELCRTINV